MLVAFPSAHTVETLLRPGFMASYKINPSRHPASQVVITDEYRAKRSPSSRRRASPAAREYRIVDSR
ncbi:hypothetical protein ACFXAW_31480 [Streptomyces sp. NPDC059445]|uniref:hypothetical protein n=1 Tax=unclassified Streptomyces TaxID=2593676 RepID=UPI0036C9FD9A